MTSFWSLNLTSERNVIVPTDSVEHQGEMDVAERYLKRAILLSSDAVKGETARSEQQTSDWIVLMNIIRDKKPSSTKASGAVVCRAKISLCVSAYGRACFTSLTSAFSFQPFVFPYDTLLPCPPPPIDPPLLHQWQYRLSTLHIFAPIQPHSE